MSVTSTDNQILYTGSGTTGPFDFDFKCFATTDLLVQKLTIATEAIVDLTETTDYSVALDEDGTGAVTLVAVLSSAYKLVITRVLPLTQEVAYVEGDKFPAVTHEEALDRAAMRDQQLQEQIDRCIIANPGTDVPTIADLNAAVTAAELAETNAEAAEAAAVIAQAAAEAAAASLSFASKEEAEAGTINTKGMTPLRTAEAIAALGGATKCTGEEIDTGTVDDKFATPKAIADSALVSETAWTDYSAVSTIVGFSSFTYKKIYTEKLGGRCFFQALLAGVSDSTATTFTLPYAINAGTGSVFGGVIMQVADNGTTKTTACRFYVNGSTVSCFTDMNAGVWTASGSKSVQLNGDYKIA